MRVKEYETAKNHVMKAVNELIQSGYNALDVEMAVTGVLLQVKDQVRIQAINEAAPEVTEEIEPEEVE